MSGGAAAARAAVVLKRPGGVGRAGGGAPRGGLGTAGGGGRPGLRVPGSPCGGRAASRSEAITAGARRSGLPAN